jgi:hypothetical protein
MIDYANIPPLPADTPRVQRVSLATIQFLQHVNKLDGLMDFVGIWWGLWTLAFPNFWYGWPVTHQLARMTVGHPTLISWTVLATGILCYACKRMHWPNVRISSSLVAFVCWCMLTTAFIVVRPIFSPGFACYSLFAILKLLSYVNHVIRIDEHVVPNADRNRA